jgi:hypothetical protein
MKRAIFSTLFALSMLACSSTLTSLQPAAVLGKGQFHTGTGVVIPTPVSAIQRVNDAGNAISLEVATEAGLAAVANLPFPITQTDVRMGLGHRLDAGIRVSTDALSLGGKWQFLGSPNPGGFDGSIGLEISRHAFNDKAYANAVQNNNALNFLDFGLFAIDNLERIDVTVPVLFGRQPTNWLNYWWGPKYSFSRVDLQSAFEIANGDDDVNENLHYIGGTAGVSFGYKRVWMILEMNAFNLIFKPEIGGDTVDAGGLVVFPALGFMTRF